MGWAVKRIVGFGMIVGMLVILTGCAVVFKTEGERESVEYELMDIRDVPEDMQKQIEKRKEEAFQITYRDMKYLYVAEGYGKKDASGYCIEINECAQNEEAIYIEAILHGPGGEGAICETEYPFYVLKIAYTEKQVIFEE